MNQHIPDPTAKLEERADRKAAKREAKKTEIAISTLDALKQLGYANTTLRDIAAQSGMSLGSLTYYFTDKAELITYCVRIYKREFIDQVRGSVMKAQGRDAVIAALSNALARSMTEDLPTHRLWYDIRNQAMFDPGFRPVVAEIEAALMDTVADAMRAAGQTDITAAPVGYAMLDGLFRYLMSSRPPDQTQEQVAEIFAFALHGIFQ